MNIATYFRLPQNQRMTRKAIALQLSAEFKTVSAQTVGIWVKADFVPGKWREPLLSILNVHAPYDVTITLK